MNKTALIILFFGLTFNPSLALEKTKTTPTPTLPVIVMPTDVKRENIIENPKKELDYKKNRLIEMAVEKGVATNTIVLLLLLPLVATLVSVVHYLLGISGFGIFVPTMVAVAMVATGVPGGLLLFFGILTISIAGNWFLKKLKLHFWPARAIGLLFISVATFGLMVVSAYLKIADISQISIFPVLFMILLVEEFTRTQLVKSKKEAMKLTLGTLGLAIFGSEIMMTQAIQKLVLQYPEMTILLTIVINIIVGNYSGIRLSEIGRFRKAIRKK
jgi:hypothetical protein